MKKILFFLIFFIIFIENCLANINITNFKNDLDKFNLDEKASFCFPVFEYAQIDYIRIIKFIDENKKINSYEKEIEIKKLITAFKGAFYYQTIIAFYWFTGEENVKFPEKPSKEYVSKLLKNNQITIKSEQYLNQISTKEFSDNKIFSTCLKSLEPFFKENIKVLSIIEYLNENAKSIEEEGLQRSFEIMKELEEKK